MTTTSPARIRPDVTASFAPGSPSKTRAVPSTRSESMPAVLATAPSGAVAKTAGMDSLRVKGTAWVFDGEPGAMMAVTSGPMRAGDGVVIPYEGPRGGPG